MIFNKKIFMLAVASFATFSLFAADEAQPDEQAAKGKHYTLHIPCDFKTAKADAWQAYEGARTYVTETGKGVAKKLVAGGFAVCASLSEDERLKPALDKFVELAKDADGVVASTRIGTAYTAIKDRAAKLYAGLSAFATE